MGKSVPDYLLDKAVFGGSFDPVHRGHILSGVAVIKKNISREIIFMPAGISPFKMHASPIPGRDRLQMIKLAINSTAAGEIKNQLQYTDIELKREGPSYTAESLRELRLMYPGEKIGFIMGADSFNSFEQWKNPSDILLHHPILVLSRKTADDSIISLKKEMLMKLFVDENPEIVSVKNSLVECSSTAIRQILKEWSPERRKELEECLPGPVLDYIIERKFYMNTG